MQEKNIGLSSRGADEEMQNLMADLLHQEQHTVEALTKEPHKADELTKTIDGLRTTRQDVVRLWGGEKVNTNYWCAVKHNLESSRRIQEIIENAARINPSEVPKLIKIANKINKEKDIAIKNFKSGKTKTTDGNCLRCEDDFGKENYEKSKRSSSETKSLNTSIHKEKDNSINCEKGGINMTDFKELGVINGGQFVGKGITVLADYMDTKYPSTDPSIFKKKGLWMNVGLGLLGQIGALYLIKNKNLKTGALIASSHALTKVVDYARETVTPTVRARLPAGRAQLRVVPRAAPIPTGAGAGLITVD